ncbi:MAG: tRNA (guanosine(37)-N1)-methyltransferase TrmD [Actinomycetes bacterium]
MHLDVVTIFPRYFEVLDLSLIGKAQRDGRLDVAIHDLREYTHDRHRTVDDTPYGGGPGMLMKPEPWGAALDNVRGSRSGPDPLLVVPSPAGERFSHEMARELADEQWLVVACGRYEGIDARVTEDAGDRFRVREVSLGDYVLNGGEVAALAIIEAVGRLLPGVVGNDDSLTEESHVDGLLEGPAYTKPASWRGRDVPPVLLSGHHEVIARARRDASLRRTAQVRPDLIAALHPAKLDDNDLAILAESGWTLLDGRFQAIPSSVAD